MTRPRSMFLLAGMLVFAVYFILDRFMAPISNREALLWMALAAVLIVIGEIKERKARKGGKKD